MTVNIQNKSWIFTWGFNQAFPNKYIRIPGSFQEAREEMIKRHGKSWSMQYEDCPQTIEMLENHGLCELNDIKEVELLVNNAIDRLKNSFFNEIERLEKAIWEALNE